MGRIGPGLSLTKGVLTTEPHGRCKTRLTGSYGAGEGIEPRLNASGFSSTIEQPAAKPGRVPSNQLTIGPGGGRRIRTTSKAEPSDLQI